MTDQQIRTRLAHRLKYGARTVKDLPIEFIVGMIFIPLACTLLAFTLDDNSKDRLIGRLSAEVVDLRTELERMRAETQRFRELSDQAIERERRHTEEGAIQAAVELSLRRENAALEARLRTAEGALDAAGREHRETMSQLDTASDYVASVEQRVAELQAANSRLTALLENRADAEERSILSCRAGQRGTYKIAGLFVPAATPSLDLSGRSLSDQDLEVIGCLRLLRTLRLSAVSSAQLSFVALLPNLSKLTLLESHIESFEFIIGAAELKSLDVRGSTVPSFRAIETLLDLEELRLASINGQPQMQDISRIRSLKVLDLTGTHPQGFQYVSEISTLKAIFLEDVSDIDLGALLELRNLHWLVLPDGETIGGRVENDNTLGEVRGYLASLRVE